MTILYAAQATAIGGRAGSVASSDGALRAKLACPPALGGQGGAGTNPEQLFAAGYAACFLETLKIVAAETGATIAMDANVTVTVRLGRDDGAEAGSLSAAVTVDLPDLDREAAETLVAKAHAICPYSEAARRGFAVSVSVP